MNPCHPLNRRDVLRAAGAGALSATVPGLLAAEPMGATTPHPLQAKAPHFARRAKRMILFFMTGGVSHVDTFDPKPKLTEMHGKSHHSGKLKGSLWKARPRGQCGLSISDLFPHVGEVVDELCLIRSLHGNHGDHFAATLHMHTGSDGSALPGVGAWLSYALGTANINLPSHVVFARSKPYGGSQAWDANFLPAYHQGTRIVPGDDPIPHLSPRHESAAIQDDELKFLAQLNRRHALDRPDNSELAARMLSFQTAQSMQRLVPDVFDLSRETAGTLNHYGIPAGDRTSFAWQCLMARRMAEAGVRVIELIDTGSNSKFNWDSHDDISRHGPLAKQIDRPIAA